MEYNLQAFKAGDILTAEQLNRIEAALRTVLKNALPVTVEMSKGSKGRIDINVSGLEGNTAKDYLLQLYRKGQSGDWEPMWDEARQCSPFGWHYLCGEDRTVERNGDVVEVTSTFPSETPTWMPNKGVFTTRWPISPSQIVEGNYTQSIDASRWLLDNLKPRTSKWESISQRIPISAGDTKYNNLSVCSLIGTKAKKDSSLYFKIGVLQKQDNNKYELVGLSKSTLKISCSKHGDCAKNHSQAILGNKASGTYISNLALSIFV
jgi:hypothetical protein